MTADKKGEVTLTASSKPSSVLKYQEMTPEVTLVEFISTSAAFHEVKKENIKQLEWDILKVFPNNIMPANAAAWYMAKRRYYMDNSYENQLLPFLLKNYPKKFSVKKESVEFLEIYNKEVARKKMHQMIRQGLLAYFTHKVEEYGVYFFDPFYYETTEPFHANLRQVTNSLTRNRSKLLPSYFAMHKDKFVYQTHSPYLVTISREPVDIRINTTGIIVSMIDNQFGIIQFPVGSTTEKAFFSAKSLFRDGWQYQGDPMKLPPMEFDGYRLPSARNKISSDGIHASNFTWYAVLVWCGRKPSPKFCSTKEDLEASPYFKGHGLAGLTSVTPGVTYEELVSKAIKSQHHQEKGGCMQVGEVLAIRKDGAIVSLAKDSEDRAFIPGWSHRNSKYTGNFLTTTQGVELAIKDLITFCLDPSQDAQGFKAVGCNVTVLKHAAEKLNGLSIAGSSQLLLPAGDACSSSATLPSSSTSIGGGNGKKKNRKNGGVRKRTKSLNGKKSGKGDVTSEDEGNKDKTRISREKTSESHAKNQKTKYIDFLLLADVEASDAYESEEDPSFPAPTSHDPDLDYDEYSDGEIQENEHLLLLKEEKEELDVAELKKKLEESEALEKEARRTLKVVESSKTIENKTAEENIANDEKVGTAVDKIQTEVSKEVESVEVEKDKSVSAENYENVAGQGIANLIEKATTCMEGSGKNAVEVEEKK